MFHWYGLFIGIAIVIGHSVAEKIEEDVNKIAPWVIGLGIVGARTWHVVDIWSYYGQNLSQIVAVWNGGMSIWGGLIGGLFGLLIYQQANKSVETWKILGAIVTGLPLAQAIGRLGNGVNGEFGNIVWILPWWAMEAVLDLFLFAIMWGLSLRGSSSQVRVGLYLIGYALIRLVLQPYRL